MPVKMEHRGFEPLASTMRMLRAPNCANAPCHDYITNQLRIKEKFTKKYFFHPTSLKNFNVLPSGIPRPEPLPLYGKLQDS